MLLLLVVAAAAAAAAAVVVVVVAVVVVVVVDVVVHVRMIIMLRLRTQWICIIRVLHMINDIIVTVVTVSSLI